MKTLLLLSLLFTFNVFANDVSSQENDTKNDTQTLSQEEEASYDAASKGTMGPSSGGGEFPMYQDLAS